MMLESSGTSSAFSSRSKRRCGKGYLQPPRLERCCLLIIGTVSVLDGVIEVCLVSGFMLKGVNELEKYCVSCVLAVCRAVLSGEPEVSLKECCMQPDKAMIICFLTQKADGGFCKRRKPKQNVKI